MPEARTLVHDRGAQACLTCSPVWESTPAQHDRALHHHICLNSEFWADPQWWAAFAPRWNGQCFLLPALQAAPDEAVFTDASGSWDCGDMWQNEWFQFPLYPTWEGTNITAKELTPIVLAATLQGHQWVGKAVQLCCDNQAIVPLHSGLFKQGATSCAAPSWPVYAGWMPGFPPGSGTHHRGGGGG